MHNVSCQLCLPEITFILNCFPNYVASTKIITVWVMLANKSTLLQVSERWWCGLNVNKHAELQVTVDYFLY